MPSGSLKCPGRRSHVIGIAPFCTAPALSDSPSAVMRSAFFEPGTPLAPPNSATTLSWVSDVTGGTTTSQRTRGRDATGDGAVGTELRVDEVAGGTNRT